MMQEPTRSLARRAFGASLIGAVLATIAVPTAFAAPKPAISSFSPMSGPVGTVVTITGQYFSGVTAVTFRNTPASFIFDSDTQVRATVPTGARTGPIRVMTPDGTGTSAQDFTVTGTPPTIASFSPTSGGPGTTVIVHGSDFTGATDVRFGGVSAVLTVDSDLKITTSVPTGASTGPIQVTTPSGTGTSATNFVVTGGALPKITSFSPTAGPVGTQVTILGSGFSGASEVRFDGASSAFTVNSDTKITATVPSTATTGRIKVTTPAGTATSATNFHVDNSPPTIASFSPTSGAVGTSVVIRGDHLSAVTQVTFNGTNATFTVTSDARIDTKVPTGATTGRIKVSSAAGSATSAQDFVVGGPPRITSILPTTGRVGASVSILGTNLAGATRVLFGSRDAGFSVVSPTQIAASVPSGASTGPVKVTTPAGTTTGPRFVVFHGRAVTLSLRGDLTAFGRVGVRDGYDPCAQAATVLIQRRASGHWRTVARVASGQGGAYLVRLPGQSGSYRALVLKRTLASGDVCGRAASRAKTHRRRPLVRGAPVVPAAWRRPE
jgi:large repetitive protein